MTPERQPKLASPKEGTMSRKPANKQLCGGDMRNVLRAVDLTQAQPAPWMWVDERTYAAVRGCSVKVLQNERRMNIGCPFRRIHGTTVRYKFGDITTFLESQPGGGGDVVPGKQPRRGAGRPRRSLT